MKDSTGTSVIWKNSVEKDLDRLPPHILHKFHLWVKDVALKGIRQVRTNPGCHDEPLYGTRIGQRSIRLNRAYRAIYIERDDGKVEFIEVIEVNKRDY